MAWLAVRSTTSKDYPLILRDFFVLQVNKDELGYT